MISRRPRSLRSSPRVSALNTSSRLCESRRISSRSQPFCTMSWKSSGRMSPPSAPRSWKLWALSSVGSSVTLVTPGSPASASWTSCAVGGLRAPDR
ncbi:hypothetical protein BE20_45280 [Sorangium cellulosum]|nr:hypothetical protein BE20_45280 [Sorangium cellulosum]